MEPKYEKSLIIIKPDAIQRNLMGEIINRLERKGLKIIGLKIFLTVLLPYPISWNDTGPQRNRKKLYRSI